MQPSCLIIGIPCLLRGGTEIQTLQLIRALVESGGYSVTVVCYFEADPEVVAEFEAAGATVRLLGLRRSLSPMRLVRRLRAEFVALKPRLIHIQYLAPGLLPIIAARLAGFRKVLATVHQPWTRANHGWKAKWMLRFGVRLCSRFLCVSEAAERSWFGSSHLYNPNAKQPSRRRHCTIHNAVDLDRIDAILRETNREKLRTELGIGDEPVIGVVSRLTREKGIDTLLAAMPGILRQVPNARLLVVGDGPERPALQAQAHSLCLSQSSVSCPPTPDPRPLSTLSAPLSTLNSQPPARHSLGDGGSTLNHQPLTILWSGRHPWPLCIQLLSMMDLVVVPSRFEGFGLTAAEAMACGKPVVAAAVDGLVEVLGGGRAGELFKPGDPADLASKVVAQLGNRNRSEHLGRAGRARIAQSFSLAHYRTRITALYDQMLPPGS